MAGQQAPEDHRAACLALMDTTPGMYQSFDYLPPNALPPGPTSIHRTPSCQIAGALAFEPRQDSQWKKPVATGHVQDASSSDIEVLDSTPAIFLKNESTQRRPPSTPTQKPVEYDSHPTNVSANIEFNLQVKAFDAALDNRPASQSPFNTLYHLDDVTIFGETFKTLSSRVLRIAYQKKDYRSGNTVQDVPREDLEVRIFFEANKNGIQYGSRHWMTVEELNGGARHARFYRWFEVHMRGQRYFAHKSEQQYKMTGRYPPKFVTPDVRCYLYLKAHRYHAEQAFGEDLKRNY